MILHLGRQSPCFTESFKNAEFFSKKYFWTFADTFVINIGKKNPIAWRTGFQWKSCITLEREKAS